MATAVTVRANFSADELASCGGLQARQPESASAVACGGAGWDEPRPMPRGSVAWTARRCGTGCTASMNAAPKDRLLLWWLRAAAFQVGCVLPGQRLVHEAFWCGAMPPGAAVAAMQDRPGPRMTSPSPTKVSETACRKAVDSRTLM